MGSALPVSYRRDHLSGYSNDVSNGLLGETGPFPVASDVVTAREVADASPFLSSLPLVQS